MEAATAAPADGGTGEFIEASDCASRAEVTGNEAGSAPMFRKLDPCVRAWTLSSEMAELRRDAGAAADGLAYDPVRSATRFWKAARPPEASTPSGKGC